MRQLLAHQRHHGSVTQVKQQGGQGKPLESLGHYPTLESAWRGRWRQAAARHHVVDVVCPDAQCSNDRQHRPHRDQVENCLAREKMSHQTCKHGRHHIARVVEDLVAPGASCQEVRARQTQRDGQQAGCNHRRRHAQGCLPGQHERHGWPSRHGDAAHRDHPAGQHQQQALGAQPVGQCASGSQHENRGQRHCSHRQPDRDRVPVVRGEQPDRQEGPDTVAHVGQKEIERVQRPAVASREGVHGLTS